VVALFLLDGCKCVGTVLLVLLLNRFVAVSISVVIVEVALCFSDGAGVRPSVSLSRLSTAAAARGWFAAVRAAGVVYQLSIDIYCRRPRLAASVGSVVSRADGGESTQTCYTWGEMTLTESVVTIRGPFCGYNLALCVELAGEDLPRYSNKI